MSVSDVLHPDGTGYDPFLQAELGEDRTGTAVTVLSALARLGLEPWTEARELTLLGRDAAEMRLKAHLAAISDIPALGSASGNVAKKLVSLLPKRASPRAAERAEATAKSGLRLPVSWPLMALVGVLILTWIYLLAHAS